MVSGTPCPIRGMGDFSEQPGWCCWGDGWSVQIARPQMETPRKAGRWLARQLSAFHGGQLIVKEKGVFTESRFQVVQPRCLFVVFGKEGTLDPVMVAALDEP